MPNMNRGDIKTLSNGDIDKKQHPDLRASVGAGERFEWTCADADFKVYDVHHSECNPPHPQGEVCNHPVYPFEDPLPSDYKPAGQMLSSRRIKPAAAGAVYKTTWRTKKNGEERDPWDPHIWIGV